MKAEKQGAAEAEEKTSLLGDAVTQYYSTCQDQRIYPCADALIRLETGSPILLVQADADRNFGNLELKALATLLQADNGAKLKTFTSLDLSRCKLGVSAGLLIAELLRHPQCIIEDLNLSFQPIGVEGAAAIAQGVRDCKTLRRLRMKNCWLKDAGAQAFVDMMAEGADHLDYLDLQNNLIEYPMCRELHGFATQQGVELQLQGNRVMDEVWNAITHGSGFVMCIVGTVFMGIAIKDKPAYYAWGVVPYCISLLVLFMSSCLYHSFHAMGRVVNKIFCNLDHSGIYCLIAGTYTPFLTILLHDLWWSRYFLWLIWTLAAAGMVFTVKYEGEYKLHIENTFYLALGWSIMVFVDQVHKRLEPAGFNLLAGGGVLYSLGVPWFVKDGHTFGFPDHVTWHLFVLAAASCHFVCIFKYIVGGSFDIHNAAL